MTWRAVVGAGALALLLVSGCSRDEGPASLHFQGANGLLIDERTKPRDGWQMTSGSLFVDDGRGWTGDPDRGEPDGHPRGTTNSAVFRLRSTSDDLEDVDLRIHFRVASFAARGAAAYDGMHLWLHYRSPDELYALSVMRRDGTTVVKRKSPADYRTIAECRSVPVDHRWHAARATATRAPGGVRLRLWVDGRRVCDMVDRDHPLLSGRVGVRTDDAEVFFDDLTVTRR